MSNVLNNLGKHRDDVKWWDIAACHGMNTNLFFDDYEIDINIAKNIDEACLSCPVISLCYQSGIDNSEYGVWGGVYLSSGEIDKSRNIHKTKEIWKRLKAKGVS